MDRLYKSSYVDGEEIYGVVSLDEDDDSGIEDVTPEESFIVDEDIVEKLSIE